MFSLSLSQVDEEVPEGKGPRLLWAPLYPQHLQGLAHRKKGILSSC